MVNTYTHNYHSNTVTELAHISMM